MQKLPDELKGFLPTSKEIKENIIKLFEDEKNL